MSIDQLTKLRVLSNVFKDGFATPSDLKELSELLKVITCRDKVDIIDKTQLKFNQL